jgi:hypothetical protein
MENKAVTDRASTPDALAIARDILARGWKPVPVPIGKKGPVIPKWQKLDITAANVERYFNGRALNVGAQMGPKSGGLADTDLDCVEAVKLAPYFLPRRARSTVASESAGHTISTSRATQAERRGSRCATRTRR